MGLFGEGQALRRALDNADARERRRVEELERSQVTVGELRGSLKRLEVANQMLLQSRDTADKRAADAERRYHELADKALEMRREGFAVPDAPPSELKDDGTTLPQEFIDAVVEVYGSARHPMARKDLAWAELKLRKQKNNPEMVPAIARKIQEGAEHE